MIPTINNNVGYLRSAFRYILVLALLSVSETIAFIKQMLGISSIGLSIS